jgi:hypothetical protein
LARPARLRFSGDQFVVGEDDFATIQFGPVRCLETFHRVGICMRRMPQGPYFPCVAGAAATLVALARDYERSLFSGSNFSLSTIRNSSASDDALIFRIMLLRCTFTVVSVMPISPAICLFSRPFAT